MPNQKKIRFGDVTITVCARRLGRRGGRATARCKHKDNCGKPPRRKNGRFAKRGR